MSKETRKSIKFLVSMSRKEDPPFDGLSSDVIIPVMGPTGVGKSTFINSLLKSIGGTQEVVEIGHGLESCTSHLKPIVIPFGNGENGFTNPSGNNEGRLVLVDTPGFDDTYEDDAEILRRISVWLGLSYTSSMKLGGVIYLHDITQTRMLGTTRRNLNMFRKLVGDNALKCVVLGTTKWKLVESAVGAKRQEQLETEFWKDMIKAGSQVFSVHDQDAPEFIDVHNQDASKIINDQNHDALEVVSVHHQDAPSVVSAHDQDPPQIGSVHDLGAPGVGSVHNQDASKVINDQNRNAPDVVNVHHQDAPNVVSAHGQDAPQVGSVHDQDAPNVVNSHNQNAPQVGSVYDQGAPEVGSVHRQDAPNAVSAHGQDPPQDGSVYYQGAPKVGSVHHQDAPDVVNTHGQDAPNVVSAHGQDAPQVGSLHDQDAAKVVNLHNRNAPEVVSAHHQDAPNVVSAHGQDAPQVGGDYDQGAPEVGSAPDQDASSDQAGTLSLTPREIVNKILDRVKITKSKTEFLLTIQRELAQMRKFLPQTDAGQTLKYSLDELLELQRRKVKNLTDEEFEHGRKELDRLLKTARDLKVPLGARIRKFFGFY